MIATWIDKRTRVVYKNYDKYCNTWIDTITGWILQQQYKYLLGFPILLAIP